MWRPQRYLSRSDLERISEIVEPTPPEMIIENVQETTAIEHNLAPPEVDISKGANVPEQEDISDMLTQKLETFSQRKEGKKRDSKEATPSVSILIFLSSFF